MPRFQITTLSVSNLGYEGEEGYMSSALDGGCYLTLVFRAGASLTTWSNLASICHVMLKCTHIFVVDLLISVGAEFADLATMRIPAPTIPTVTHYSISSGSVKILFRL